MYNLLGEADMDTLLLKRNHKIPLLSLPWVPTKRRKDRRFWYHQNICNDSENGKLFFVWVMLLLFSWVTIYFSFCSKLLSLPHLLSMNEYISGSIYHHFNTKVFITMIKDTFVLIKIFFIKICIYNYKILR